MEKATDAGSCIPASRQNGHFPWYCCTGTELLRAWSVMACMQPYLQSSEQVHLVSRMGSEMELAQAS